MLKLAVLSDFHLGFGQGTERYEDSFKNASLALELAAKSEPNLILLVGDIFHEKIPKPEVLAKAIEMFTRANRRMKTNPLLIKKVKDNKAEEVKKVISPVICIWGTHERRHAQSVNPVQLLEKAGLMYCLHKESIQLNIGYDKVGLHGLSGTPEPYVKNAFKEWNPKPLLDCFNIMLLHQNFKELLPKPEDEWLGLSDLPKGFDLFLLGHFHANYEKKHPEFNTPVLIPGSTIATQLTKTESEKEKGFYLLEIGRQKADVKFIPIPTRPIFYEKLNVSGKRPVEISAEISTIIRKHLETKPKEKPLVRIKLEGALAEGFTPADLNFSSIMDEFAASAIISMDKINLKSAGLEEQSKLLQDLKEKKISLDMIGLELLRENLKENISLKKLENIFNHLTNEAFEQAESEILVEDTYLREELAPPKPKEIEEKPKPEPKVEIPKEIEIPKPKEIDKATVEKEQVADVPVEQEPKPAEQPKEIEKVKEEPKVKPRRKVDPKETELAESGMSLLAGIKSTPKAAPKIAALQKPKPAPKPAPKSKPKRDDVAQTAELASSGLSKLAGGAGPKAPAPKKIRKKKADKKKGKKFSIDTWLETSKK